MSTMQHRQRQGRLLVRPELVRRRQVRTAGAGGHHATGLRGVCEGRERVREEERVVVVGEPEVLERAQHLLYLVPAGAEEEVAELVGSLAHGKGSKRRPGLQCFKPVGFENVGGRLVV